MKIDNTKKTTKTKYYDESDLDKDAELDFAQIESASWVTTAISAEAVKLVTIDNDLSPHIPATLVMLGDMFSEFGENSPIKFSNTISGSQLSALLKVLSEKMSVQVNMDKAEPSYSFYTVEVHKNDEN